MRALRGTEIPIEHMAAELAALPLCADAGLRLSVASLDPQMGDATAKLWRQAESDLLKNFASFSVDEITSLRDWLWFSEPGLSRDPKSGRVSLTRFLRMIANSALVFAGNVFRPKIPPWASGASSFAPSGSLDARARRFWRWVSFALPPDLLMASHPAVGAVSAEVELLSPILSNILRDRGFAEPHMHLSAALDFGTLWISTLHALADPEAIREKSFESPGADFDHGQDFGRWLIRAAIGRYVAAAFMAHHRRGLLAPDVDFDTYLSQEVLPLFSVSSSSGGSAINFRRGAYVDPGRGAALRMCLHELATGRFLADSPFPHLQRLYSQLTNIKGRWTMFPTSLEQIRYADPIVNMFPPLGPGQRSSEMQFVAAALSYLETKNGAEDRSFNHLFWQQQRIRVRYYRHVVQRPLTPGLQWFLRSFSRLKPGRQLLGRRALFASAANLCGLGFGLSSLEVRLSPEAEQSKLRTLLVEIGQAMHDLGLVASPPTRTLQEGEGLLEILEETRRRKVWKSPLDEIMRRVRLSLTDKRTPEVGVVFHFSRERGGGMTAGQATAHGRNGYADPALGKNLGYRFSWFYKQKRREAQTIAGLLRRFPQLLALVRGIDVCTDELGVPNWVLAPLVRYVKEIAGASSSYSQAKFGSVLPPLRTTAHAGEDFVHLLGGLRRIEESIEFFRLGQGDRLGHAIALGISPKEWAYRIGGISMTKLERLFDLAWEWSFCTSRSLNLPAGRTQYIIESVQTLTKEIFNHYSDPPQVAKFMNLLRDESELALARFPDGPLDDEAEYIVRRKRRALRDIGTYVSDLEILKAINEERGRKDPGMGPWYLLYSYMTDPGAFLRGQDQVLVDPAFEAESLEVVQQELRRKIGTAGIIVEINPSSNLLIGNLADLQNHPLWRLKSPRREEEVRVAVCIGSDDPLTFATKTREEYQLVYDTLTLAGLSDMEARVWLEEVRLAGQDSRFTLPLPLEWDWIPTDPPVDVRHVRELL